MSENNGIEPRVEAQLYGVSKDNFAFGFDTISQRAAIAVLSDGSLGVTLISNTEGANVGNIFLNTDELSLVKVGMYSVAVPVVVNPSGTGDRWRNNGEAALLASAARTASADSADFTNHNWKGGHFIIDVSAITATPSIVVTVQGKDSISGNYYDILVGVAITATGTTVLKVYPGIGQVINGAASDILPRTYRVSVANADGDSITYSISANLIV